MANGSIEKKSDFTPQWFEDTIEIHGYRFELQSIKAAYNELQALVDAEGDRIVASLKKEDGETQERFVGRKRWARANAFLITVTIIGEDGTSTYGSNQEIFDSKNLPNPIKAIFFTNENSYRSEANGNLPSNRFRVWLNFNKTPIFDPSPLLSEPTPNGSKVEIHSDSVSFFRAVQNIVNTKIKRKRQMFFFMHAKFAYDIGLWSIALPYSLYFVSVSVNRIAPIGGQYEYIRTALYIYLIGLAILFYRAVVGYFKWVFPVNSLKENEDSGSFHRWFFGLGATGAVGGILKILWEFITKGVTP